MCKLENERNKEKMISKKQENQKQLNKKYIFLKFNNLYFVDLETFIPLIILWAAVQEYQVTNVLLWAI